MVGSTSRIGVPGRVRQLGPFSLALHSPPQRSGGEAPAVTTHLAALHRRFPTVTDALWRLGSRVQALGGPCPVIPASAGEPRC